MLLAFALAYSAAYGSVINSTGDPTTLMENGYGGCSGGAWKKIGTASTVEDAKALMLADDECSVDGSMLFYSEYSHDESWSVRCAGPDDHHTCAENNTNWKEYVLYNPDKLNTHNDDGEYWMPYGPGGCEGGVWKKIGKASSLHEAEELMEDDADCSKDQSVMFYSDYSYSWGVMCIPGENITEFWNNCNSTNTNWNRYILFGPPETFPANETTDMTVAGNDTCWVQMPKNTHQRCSRRYKMSTMNNFGKTTTPEECAEKCENAEGCNFAEWRANGNRRKQFKCTGFTECPLKAARNTDKEWAVMENTCTTFDNSTFNSTFTTTMPPVPDMDL